MIQQKTPKKIKGARKKRRMKEKEANKRFNDMVDVAIDNFQKDMKYEYQKKMVYSILSSCKKRSKHDIRR